MMTERQLNCIKAYNIYRNSILIAAGKKPKLFFYDTWAEFCENDNFVLFALSKGEILKN